MFKKKECQNCGKKINAKNNFCPSCGDSLKNNSKKEDWGMLGETDTINEFEQFSNSLFGGVGGKIIGGMLGRTMKMLEKEMKNQTSTPRTNFELIINGKRIDPKNIMVAQPKQIMKNTEKKIQRKSFSDEQIKKLSKLPRKEPRTEMKRLSDSVIYEIEVPGVGSFDDISIAKLENSIEITAIGKSSVYKKLIPVNLPIKNYQLLKEKLILELRG